MFTKVHTKVLEVECGLPDAQFNAGTMQAVGIFNQTTFTPVITSYQAIGASMYSTGSGRSLLDMSTTFTSNNSLGAVLNSRTVSSAWCNCTITSEADAVINSLHYYYWSDSVAYQKKVRYIDLYRIENGNYILHQTFSTSAPYIGGPINQLLVLTKPIQFKGTIALRVVARTSWGDPYILVGEIFIKGFTLSA